MSDLDTAALSNELIKTALNEAIEKQLGTSAFETDIQLASGKGENFVGIVYRVTCRKLSNNNDDDDKSAETKYILKIAPQHIQRREAFKSRKAFLREIYLFSDVLPYFRQFEESKGIIPEEDGLYEYPACLSTVDTEPFECLILEDLSVDKFEMLDRIRELPTVDHVNMVMRALAKWHAISFAIKDQQPEKFAEITSNLDELFLRKDDENFSKYMELFGPSVCKMVKEMGDEQLESKIEELFTKNILSELVDLVDSSGAEPYAVICHGDCWNNNILFRLDENRKPLELRLLDFQISRYASPALDLIYYIFCNTQKELRDQHYEEFLNVYHSTLTKHLKRLGSDAEKLYPYSAMLEQFKKFGKFGAYIAAIFLPMMTAEGSAGPDLNELADDIKEGKEFDENIFNSEGSAERYFIRLKGVFEDMKRLGYI